jgi:lipoate-protein ligase A
MDIIPFRKENAALCMGMDEALLEARARNLIPDTIRFFQFDPSTVSIGYFQSLITQVDLEACGKHGIDLVRRITGGGSVFHDNEGEITYSIVVGANGELLDYTNSYRYICRGIVEALDILGLRAEFKPVNDVLVNGKKISGSAQTRRGGVILQHGTLMYNTNIETLSEILNVSDEKLSDKFVQSVKKREPRSWKKRARHALIMCLRRSCLVSQGCLVS